MADFVFNDGRPYAELLTPSTAKQPAITQPAERLMERELQHWVRSRWHDLLRESGLHVDPGHLPTDVD